jgi:hypothetical protein
VASFRNEKPEITGAGELHGEEVSQVPEKVTAK